MGSPSALTWWRRAPASRRRPRTHRRFPKMAAATSSETGCGEAAAGEKRGPLGIPEAVFVVSGGSAGRAAPRRGWGGRAGVGAAPRQPGPSPVRRHLRRAASEGARAAGQAAGLSLAARPPLTAPPGRPRPAPRARPARPARDSPAPGRGLCRGRWGVP